MDQHTLELETGGDFAVVDLTDDVTRWARGRGSGLVHLLAPHATAGLALMETGSGSEADAREVIERLVPRDGRWRHSHGAPGHGADHVLPVLVSPSLTLAVVDGRLDLGTWQSVVLVDPNRDNHRREVRLSFLAG